MAPQTVITSGVADINPTVCGYVIYNAISHIKEPTNSLY